MANILDKIIATKRREVEAIAALRPVYAGVDSNRPLVSMSEALRNSSTGIIAEFKRRSPSKGDIHPMAEVSEIVPAYEQAGAAACSILTDTTYFGGALTDLAVARSVSDIPLLRKDFIVSEFQIGEAARVGADAVLLIAAALTATEIKDFTDCAHGCGLEVLFEIHNVSELDKYYEKVDMVGVNNRDLSTFITDPQLSATIASLLPEEVIKVAESGLTSFEEVRRLRDIGYRGFLIGETFMKTEHPGHTLKKFIDGTL